MMAREDIILVEGRGQASNARMDCVAREKDDEWNAGNRVTARDFHCAERATRCRETFVYSNFFSRTVEITRLSLDK